LPRNVHRSLHRRRRWPRRTGIGLAILVVLVPLLGIAGYLYVDSALGGIPRVGVPALTPLKAGQPMDLLIVGSDSRSFVTTPGEARAFGSRSTQTGQRSDVIIIARFSPNGEVEMMSIPRDTWVPIAGGGSNKINAAFNNGPNQLVQTIQADFGIPINHVLMANFAGFEGMVNALGGIYLDFRYPVRDQYSGLNVHQTGCQLVDGAQSLALVRSRHLFYFEKGSWHYDGMSDWSRIRRQQAFFHALLDRVHSVIPNIFRLNSFLNATVSDLQADSSFASSEMISLGLKYHSLNVSKLLSAVLPTSAEVIDGQDALVPAKPYSTQTIARFLAFGRTPARTPAPGASVHRPRPKSTTSTLPPGVVSDSPQTLPEPWNPIPC
jgi:LCP family protein required for cell wall assembly